ncbi:MAG: PQQ-binding-like beta-propeller repeat protein [Vulcanimicrobiota bacterium]
MITGSTLNRAASRSDTPYYYPADAIKTDSTASVGIESISDRYIGSTASAVSLDDASKMLSKSLESREIRKLAHPGSSFSFPRTVAVSDGSVFINNFHSEVTLMKDDKVSWKYDAGDFCNCHFRQSGYSDGVFHIGISNRMSDDGKICAVKDGKSLWEYKTRGQVISSPCAGAEGIIYAGDDKGWLYAVKDNRLLWEFKTDAPIGNSPFAGPDGTIYVSNESGKLYAVRNGKEKWKCLPGNFNEIPSSMIPTVGPDGTVYAVSYWTKKPFAKEHRQNCRDNCRIFAIKEERTFLGSITGRKIWEFKTEGVERSHSYGGQDEVCIGPDGTIYVGNSGTLYAVKDGKEKWRYFTEGTIESSPDIDEDGTVYVGSMDGRISAIKDGKQLWSLVTGNQVTHSPSIAPDGTIYLGNGEHDVIAIDSPIKKKRNMLSSISDKTVDKNAPQTIEQVDDWIIIGGLKVPKKV